MFIFDFSFLFHWLKLLVWSWIEVVCVDIFVLLLISKESIQSFIVKYDISCKFLQIPFIRVRKLESLLEQKVQASGKKKKNREK